MWGIWRFLAHLRYPDQRGLVAAGGVEVIDMYRDSLYVVGGSLSVDCVGALKEIPDIDNSFTVTTDEEIEGEMQATKLIIVDQDPPNDLFYDSLGTDIIRAIAWVEYAGSNDTTHCDGNYNEQWNNYWDHVIVGQDTCYETKFPCENIASTATGTMQMIRYKLWEPAFGRPDYFPPGYFQVSWDSLAWSWKINVFNGKFIYFIDNFARMTPEQKTWPLVCELCDPADSVPLYPNQEDLSTYGYHEGANAMRQINSDNWLQIMKSNEDEGAKYVRKVRGSKYAKEWED
jgi:hypothetical protein